MNGSPESPAPEPHLPDPRLPVPRSTGSRLAGPQTPTRFLTRAEVKARAKGNWMIAAALLAFAVLVLFVTIARLTLNVRGGDLS